MKEGWRVDLGRMCYKQAWDFQHRLHSLRVQGEIPDTLIFVEHPPVITLGRSAKSEHLRLPMEDVQKRGVEVFQVERGGDVTFHGPGQLVGYPIFRLEELRMVQAFVRNIEQSIVEALKTFGIPACTLPGYTGVWVDDRNAEPGGGFKIASIGLAIRRGVSFHGFALNVSTALSYFDLIVPCGLPDVRMTSMEKWLGEKVLMEDVKEAMARSFEHIFQLSLIPMRYVRDFIADSLSPVKPSDLPFKMSDEHIIQTLRGGSE